MKLKLYRYASGSDDTLGLLFDMSDGRPRFLCYTLEDEHRDVKVYGETCIPAGSYRITLRTEGGFHTRYSTRFPGFHLGMLWLRGVPDFDWIYFHVGNDDGDTKGCILVGDRANSNVEGLGAVLSSAQAYKRVYKPIATELATGGEVEIDIVDWYDEPRVARHGSFR